MWSRPEIVVMITLGREKLMQHILLGVHEATAGALPGRKQWGGQKARVGVMASTSL